MFLVEEVCGRKELVDKYLSSSLYLASQVITHGVLGFPQCHLKGSWILMRGGVLMETG
jgi:hypothetical protein